MTLTEAQKRATYNWRKNHKEHFNELAKKHAKTSYEKECYYSYERIAKQQRNIKIN